MAEAATAPPEPGEFRKSNHARKRAAIMDAAASVFAEAGYSGASTGTIAARLGMTQSNLYYYFRSKDDALEEICLVALDGYIRGAKAILASRAPFRRRLLETVQSHLAILTQRPDHFVTFLTCRQELPEAGRHRVGRITREYESLVERLIAEGRASGEIGAEVDPAFATSCLLALCHNPAIYRRAFLGRDFETLTNDLAALFLDGIAPGGKHGNAL
jgi:AcrR family transcriptional regulator